MNLPIFTHRTAISAFAFCFCFLLSNPIWSFTASYAARTCLGSNGRLQIPKGKNGTINLDGYTVKMDAKEGPVLVPMPPGVWSKLGAGTNAGVRALAFDANGNLYAGGFFTSAGNVNTGCVAKWNGSVWSAVGNLAGQVNALAFDTDGTLYAGGTIYTSGGTSLNSIAKWNGSQWSMLGQGLNNPVLAIAIDNNHRIYAGGYFFFVDNDGPNSNVAWWDGAIWHSMDGGINGAVLCLAVDANGALYAGGGFDIAGGAPIDGLAKWTGSDWVDVGGGVSNIGQVSSIVIDANNHVIVGGYFLNAGNIQAPGVAKWNGSVWSAYGDKASTIESVTIGAGNKLFAAGLFKQTNGTYIHEVAQWNGTLWESIGSNFDAQTLSQAFVLRPNNSGGLYVGGDFALVGGLDAMNIAKWQDATTSSTTPQRETASKIYPNPATDKLYFNEPAMSATPVQILNIEGKLVLEAQNSWKEIDISKLPSGWYSLVTTDHRGKPFVQQFFKQ